MNTKKISILVLAMVAVIAIIGLIMMFTSAKQGAITFHQVLKRDYAVFVDYRPCDQSPCGLAAEQIGEQYIGDAIGTVNAVCRCPDGQVYQIDTRRRY